MEEGAYGDPEVLNSQGLGHSLVLFWRSELKFNYYEFRIDPNKYHIIGCDEDQRRQLLLYRSKFVGSTIRSYRSDTPKGVIERVFRNYSPEMSPNILHYSEDEYPHRAFAFSCGIRSSFCFPFCASAKSGIMEIVSTCNQDVVTLKKFCQSFQGFNWSLSFPIINVQDYAIKEIDHFLEVVSQTFHLPLTQCWRYLIHCTVVHQFSHRDFENLAPWCHFKDACIHTHMNITELSSSENSASFCRNMKELSITQYPFAHYAQNCGSISCFTIFLGSYGPYGLPGKEWALEFFLPPQEMDNYYPQTLLSSIWAKMKECLPNYKLASGEQLGQVLSVKVINSSARNEPEFFELGQHDSSLPHHEGSEYTPTLNLFINGTEHRSNSNSYEEAATGKTSKRLPHQDTEITLDMLEEESHIEHIEPHSLVCHPKRPVDILEYEGNTLEMDHSALGMTLEEPSKLKKHTVTAERVENVVEVSSDEDFEYAVTPASKRLKKSKIPFTKENISKQFGRPLKDAAEIFSVDVLEEELHIKHIEPHSLVCQPKRPVDILENERNTLEMDHSALGMTLEEPSKLKKHTVTAERVENVVEVSPEKGIEYAATPESKRLKKSIIPCTVENISKQFGRPLKDAAESFGVSVSTFKRRCRDVGISWWQPCKSKIIDGEPGEKNFFSGMPNLPNRPVVVCHENQDLNTMTVKVAYNTENIRFPLPSSSGFAELENNVIERLPLDRKSFRLKYQDDEGDWISIACDKDVQECMKLSRSLKRTTIKMLLGPPINNQAP